MTQEWEYQDEKKDFNLQNFLLKNIFNLVFLFIGLFLLGLGGYYVYGDKEVEDDVEIIQEETDLDFENNIFVEVSGAVNSPGVYEMELNSRVEDAIKAAEGLSDSADLAWIAKTINRAARLTDGQKIYIRSEDEQSAGESANNTGGDQSTSTTILGVSEEKVNINEASKEKLEELWGIGPVTAESIIVHRPYTVLEDLLEKDILKQNVYDRNKDLMTVY